MASRIEKYFGSQARWVFSPLTQLALLALLAAVALSFAALGQPEKYETSAAVLSRMSPEQLEEFGRNSALLVRSLHQMVCLLLALSTALCAMMFLKSRQLTASLVDKSMPPTQED